MFYMIWIVKIKYVDMCLDVLPKMPSRIAENAF